MRELTLLGLALMMGCPTPSVVDDTEEETGDTDTDADYATIVARTSVEADFYLDDDEDENIVCRDTLECNIGVSDPGTYEVIPEAKNWVFGDKAVVVDKVDDTVAEWGEGQWGADLEGDWVQTEDSDCPGLEHEVEINRAEDGTVVFELNRASGCTDRPVTMTGLTFDYDSGDSFSCHGYTNEAMDEIFIELAWTGGTASYHLVPAD
jgi:hypothetical protein